MHLRFSGWFAVLTLCAACLLSQPLALASEAREYQLKAAFLHKFAVYTEWSDDALSRKQTYAATTDVAAGSSVALSPGSASAPSSSPSSAVASAANQPVEPLPLRQFIHLCVFNVNRFQGALDAIDSKPVGKRWLRVIPLQNLDDVSACHMLYLDNQALSEWRWDEAKYRDILTVSERESFLESGGMISLYIEKGRLRFAVNLQNTRRGGVNLTARMLRLAKVVGD